MLNKKAKYKTKNVNKKLEKKYFLVKINTVLIPPNTLNIFILDALKML